MTRPIQQEPMNRSAQPARATAGPASTPANAATRRSVFRAFSQATAEAMGTSWAFVVSALSIVVWAATGPLFNFSDTWQLVINTSTTVVTFLMVFVIQNTQNRDARAMHLKLDEVVRALTEARNELVNVEEADDATVEQLKQEFRDLHEQ